MRSVSPFVRHLSRGLVLTLALTFPCRALGGDLATWNDTRAKERITTFLSEISNTSSKSFVAPRERVAVVDLDGTLFNEFPQFAQFLFSMWEVARMSVQQPELLNRPTVKHLVSLLGQTPKIGQPFTFPPVDVLDAKISKEQAAEIWHLALASKSFEEKRAAVRAWLREDIHPTLKRKRVELFYRPMQELISLLRKNQFRVFIVTGSSVDFARSFVEDIFGIPPENVMGTYPKREFLDNGSGQVERLPELDTRVDGEQKVLAIDLRLGVRPIIAIGNSDGDGPMLAYTTAGSGKRLGILIHHDDAKRELSYDRLSNVGKLDKALDRAPTEGWVVVSMKDDWKVIFLKDK
jgi:phosphoserine phosphatase